jgi:hypothetical protein
MRDSTRKFRNSYKAAAIFHLRNELRQTHVDIRLNQRICEHSWEIINAVEHGQANVDLNAIGYEE